MTTQVLVLKTGALGDVLRTTAILPGLAQRYPDLRVTWVTAHGARPLVEHHPLVDQVASVDPKDSESVGAAPVLRPEGGGRWQRVLSFDDEEPLCRLASAAEAESLSGALMKGEGERAYTDDVAAWFDMGLLSRLGKEAADRLKIENERTHPAIYAEMLGIEAGKPALPLPAEAVGHARSFRERNGLEGQRIVGLNTGAGGRWTSKGLPVERVVELGVALTQRLEGDTTFLVLGGQAETERNAAILAGLTARGARVVDGGADNGLLEFAALVGLADLLVTSDSLALHMGVTQDVPIVSFFAPTSAAEIELYGLGEKVVSTAPDYCSYRPDADNSTITVERLAEAAERVLGQASRRSAG